MKRINLYWQIRGVLRLLFRLGNWHVHGVEHVPLGGPLLIVVNHISAFEAPLVAATLQIGPIAVLAKAEFAHPLNPLGWLMRTMDVIFVHRGEVDRHAIKAALRVLRAGGILGLAPEGTRSKTGGLQRGREGAAYLALQSGAPILPVGVWGQERIPQDLLHLRRPTYHVRFGPVFTLEYDRARPKRQQLAEATDVIMRRIAVLLPPAYRGVYADVEETSGGSQ
ncbi:MAG: 1-acyl-sn-glycerol-3-phosphate acyltransferase [Ardenticatenia bacterium]|nr:MAG: 1-acyl-sn-glycerol-3-phosphate acyltransferase [Ardenticatenia bacterium]